MTACRKGLHLRAVHAGSACAEAALASSQLRGCVRAPAASEGALGVHMERWVARGLQLVTEVEASTRAVGARGHDGEKSGGAAGDRGELLERDGGAGDCQALLDSEVLQAMLMSTVERCLGLHGSSHEEGWPVSHLLAEVSAVPEEPLRGRRAFADGRADASLQVDYSDEESSVADTDRRSFESQPESSPTSIIWSEWDSFDRRANRKRRREDESQEPSWDLP